MSKVAPILASKCRCACSCMAGDRSVGPGEARTIGAPTVRFQPQVDEANSDGSEDSEDEEGESIALLRVRVRALEKYKANYELLCAQLGELNAQVGRQLARHESDVQALQATIELLQTRNHELEKALHSQQQITEQDREYSERVHKQLATAAELLKATEKRVECKEEQLLAEVETAKENLEEAQEQLSTLRCQHAALQNRLEANERAYEEQRNRESKKHDMVRSKLKHQVTAAKSKYDELTSQIQKHRFACRESKKLVARLQSEAGALRKQLNSSQQDGEHLVSILDSQKIELEETKQSLASARRSNKNLHANVVDLTREREELRTEILLLQEQLVKANRELATCQSELKSAKVQLEERQVAIDNVTKKYETMTIELRKQKQKLQEVEEQRSRAEKYRCEVRRMRQLLEVNAQRAAESSKDVVSLKQELEHVQELLRGMDMAATRKATPRNNDRSQVRRIKERVSDSELDASTDSWCDLLLQNGKAEESVLKCAIMDQVRTFAA